MRVREALWHHVSDVYAAILSHPFVRGLTDGSLDVEVFREYVVQDALYLSAFARAVATVGTKAPDDDSAVTLLENAKGALSVERASLHEYLASEWGMGWDEVLRAEMNPTNFAYTNYLLSVAALSPFEEGLAAVLPCFWVYFEVGRELVRAGSPVPAYRRWIETYSSPEYEKAVASVVELSERHFSGLEGGALERVKLHFRTSTVYEWMFWDAAYRRERWPFGRRM